MARPYGCVKSPSSKDGPAFPPVVGGKHISLRGAIWKMDEVLGHLEGTAVVSYRVLSPKQDYFPSF